MTCEVANMCGPTEIKHKAMAVGGGGERDGQGQILIWAAKRFVPALHHLNRPHFIIFFSPFIFACLDRNA